MKKKCIFLPPTFTATNIPLNHSLEIPTYQTNISVIYRKLSAESHRQISRNNKKNAAIKHAV